MDSQSFAIFMVFAIPLAVIIGGTLLAALKILKGGNSSRDAETDREETRLIQELHRGLSRLEERVEALETLLLERSDRKERHDR